MASVTAWAAQTNQPAEPERQTMNATFADSISNNLTGAESAWAAAALKGGSGVSGRWESCAMSAAQQQVIFRVGLRQWLGMLPLPGRQAGTAIWCHAQTFASWQACHPEWYKAASGNAWHYKACDSSTFATVSHDGVLTGRTRSEVSLSSTGAWIDGDPVPPEIGTATGATALDAAYAAYDAAQAAYRDAYARLDTDGACAIGEICEAKGAIRRLADYAMAMGAPKWVPWDGK